jgi:hypothetical protein
MSNDTLTCKNCLSEGECHVSECLERLDYACSNEIGMDQNVIDTIMRQIERDIASHCLNHSRRDTSDHRPLTEREIRLVAEACYWRSEYVDCNPDVGMGPSDGMIVDDIAKNLNLHLSRDEVRRIIKIFAGS